MSMDLYFHGARCGDALMVKRMIERDPQHNLNRTNHQGKTALECACDNGHMEVAAVLLDHGDGMNLTCNDLNSCLYQACTTGSVCVVEKLIKRGADPLAKFTGEVTPLIKSSFKGHVHVVQWLLHLPEVLSTINDRSILGMTPLWHGCNCNHPEVVRVLLQAGADPFITNNEGLTSWDTAVMRGHQECIDVLVEWDRSYITIKARYLYDAYYHHHHAQQAHDDNDDGGMEEEEEVVEVEPWMTYLKDRLLAGEELPRVEVGSNEGEGDGDDDVVGSVVKRVVCDLKGELFFELMKMMDEGVNELLQNED